MGFFLRASSLAANEWADGERRVCVLSELVQGEDVSLLWCVVVSVSGARSCLVLLLQSGCKAQSQRAVAAGSSEGASLGEEERGAEAELARLVMPRTLVLPVLCFSWE